MNRWRSVIVCAMVGAFGCAAGDTTAEPTARVSADQTFKRNRRRAPRQGARRCATREQLIRAYTTSADRKIALSELRGLSVTSAPRPAVTSCPRSHSASPRAPATPPRAWSWRGRPTATIMPGPRIPAYMLGGARVSLDPRRAPTCRAGGRDPRNRLTMLQENRSGQRPPAARRAPAGGSKIRAARREQTSRPRCIKSIRLVDDQESWISGAAENLRDRVRGDRTNAPQLVLVDLPYLDNDHVTYSPNQIIINWSNFQYQVANIQLFEHDSNTNYQTLIAAIISAVGAAGRPGRLPR